MKILLLIMVLLHLPQTLVAELNSDEYERSSFKPSMGPIAVTSYLTEPDTFAVSKMKFKCLDEERHPIDGVGWQTFYGSASCPHAAVMHAKKADCDICRMKRIFANGCFSNPLFPLGLRYHALLEIFTRMGGEATLKSCLLFFKND